LIARKSKKEVKKSNKMKMNMVIMMMEGVDVEDILKQKWGLKWIILVCSNFYYITRFFTHQSRP
jgi:hypothetical protein